MLKYLYNKIRGDDGLLLQDQEVIKLLLQAKKRADIAKELEMPLGSVHESCKRIFRNYNCGSLPELMLKYQSEE